MELALWLAMGATPWQGMDADVAAEAVVKATPEQVTATLADLPRASALFSDDCLARWSFGVPSQGQGAMARVSYTPHWMNRRLTLTVSALEPGKRVDWDHAGDKGFLTRFTVTPSGEGAKVSVLTPLVGPPWPFAKLYQVHIKTTWEACYIDALRRLDGP